MKREIPVFFSIDDGYAPYLAVALSSAIRNSSKERNYRAIILHKGLSDENIKRISALACEHFSVEFAEMEGSFDEIGDRMGNRLRCDYFTLTIYFRLFIPEMFPQYDKAIYIDSDVVIPGDLAVLFDTDIGDNYIGACVDRSVSDVEPLAKYMEEAVGVSRNKYINSGVLLMNLGLLRQKKLGEHFLSLLAEYAFDCIAPDQDYLNAICKDKIYYLDDRWDAMPNERKPIIEDAALIHYNLFSKPWCYDGIQYSEEFWEAAEQSGYIDEIRAYKASYSEEQKKSDSECLELLIRRGAEIAESAVTFRRMHENGVKIRL